VSNRKDGNGKEAPIGGGGTAGARGCWGQLPPDM
jgi:hypothetical protein